MTPLPILFTSPILTFITGIILIRVNMCREEPIFIWVSILVGLRRKRLLAIKDKPKKVDQDKPITYASKTEKYTFSYRLELPAKKTNYTSRPDSTYNIKYVISNNIITIDVGQADFNKAILDGISEDEMTGLTWDMMNSYELVYGKPMPDRTANGLALEIGVHWGWHWASERIRSADLDCSDYTGDASHNWQFFEFFR